jgi:hypothetical protein
VTADDDDDGLKSLRAVWLSMPDEDPPERGLADLMAAARVKAETMATPSLWQRFVDAMRRPPVLALATVMVLLGGAVLVSNRDKGMSAQPTVSTPEAPGTARDELRDEGGARSAGSAAAAPATTAMPEAVVEESRPTPPPTQRPEAKAKSGSKGIATTPQAEPIESPKTSAKLDRRRDDAAPLDGDGEAEKAEAVRGGTTAAKETRRREPTVGAAQSPVQSDSAALAASGPSSSEIHQMARKLAARGDCKAAQTLTNRIAKQDPVYYKAKVVPDKAFDRCVLAP